MTQKKRKLYGLTEGQERLTEKNFEREFEKFEHRLAAERASNTRLQQKKQMTHEERARKSSTALAMKIHEFNKKYETVPCFESAMDQARQIARNVEEKRHRSYINHKSEAA